MITKATNAQITFPVGIFASYCKTRLFFVIKNVLDEVECATRLKPFIVKVLHFGRGLQNNIPTLKNGCIKCYVPKERRLRRGLS